MNTKQNLHTHTTYCDGKDSPREIIEAAIQKGFGSIGFSGHSYMEYSKEYSMSIKGTKEYIKEIGALKNEYKGKIDVFCGIEYDMYSNINTDNFDYVIGSVHYLKKDGILIDFDRSTDCVEAVINTHFAGNGMEYAKKYFSELKLLPQYVNADIIGHFDIITKHIERKSFFDFNAKEYLSYAFDAIHALKGKIPYFEVNTGAIARGFRTTPYPQIEILKELDRLGFGAIISSDCHNKDMLDCSFSQTEELLKQCGIKYKYILTDNGFKPIKL